MEFISLIFGIFAILLCWVPMLDFILALITLVLGILSLNKKNTKRKYAIASITFGSIGMCISIIIIEIILFATFFSSNTPTKIDSINSELTNTVNIKKGLK